MGASDLIDRAVEAQGAGRYQEALSLIGEVLNHPDRNDALKAEALRRRCYIISQCLRRPGPEAVMSGREAVRLAKRTRDPQLVANCLLDAAMANIHNRDYDSAER